MAKAFVVPIINRSENSLPEYATRGASGMDIRAFIGEHIQLKPLERVLVTTGISMVLPENYEAQTRPRSGLALKQGITVLNSPGTIDADYRGEVKVILINLSSEKQIIQNNDRIAQLVFQKVEKIEWKLADQLTDTERGSGAFGYTGKQ